MKNIIVILALLFTVNMAHADIIFVKISGVSVTRVELYDIKSYHGNHCLAQLAFPKEKTLDHKIYRGEVAYTSKQQIINAIDAESCKMKDGS